MARIARVLAKKRKVQKMARKTAPFFTPTPCRAVLSPTVPCVVP